MTDALASATALAGRSSRAARATPRGGPGARWRTACFTWRVVRHVLAAALLLAIVAPTPLAHAGRGLTAVQAAEVKLLLLRAQAGRPSKPSRQESAARSKKQIRDAKMRAALRLGAEIKSERARKKAERAEARKREAEKKDAARLRFIEDLLRTRAAGRSR